MHLYEVLRRPIITEKNTILQEQDKYVFVVHMKANKLEVKRAVEEIYGVNVNRVRTMVMPGKISRMRGRRRSTRRAPWKKAVVTLAPGERIEALEA